MDDNEYNDECETPSDHETLEQHRSTSMADIRYHQPSRHFADARDTLELLQGVFSSKKGIKGVGGALSLQTLAASPVFRRLRDAFKKKFGFDSQYALSLITLYQASTPIVIGLWDLYVKFGTVSASMPSHHKLARRALEWLTANTKSKASNHIQIQSHQYCDWSCDDGDNRADAWNVTPVGDTHKFHFEGHLFVLEQGQAASRHGLAGNVIIRCMGRNKRPLQKFLAMCDGFSQAQKTTTVVLSDHTSVSRPSRPLTSIDIEPVMYDKLLGDATDFFDSETKKYYAQNGTPYRRGYLLYGPPGSGKTSLSVALAGHFDVELHIIDLLSDRMYDHALLQAFRDLPQRCVVLLEDIDSAGIVREDLKVDSKPTA
ncbi:hypothetical protein LTS18_000228, partial [Coniosporium uncinatum]